MLLKKEDIEMDLQKKEEKAVQDALKIRLHKTTCDCCKKPVDNSKDEKNRYNTYYFMWENRFLCEKCMTFQIFKTYPVLILLLIREILAYIIRLPFKPFCRVFRGLSRNVSSIHAKIYRLLSKICSFFWTYCNKLSEKSYDKWEELVCADYEVAHSWFERGNKYFNLSHTFFQYYMHWDDMWKLVMDAKCENYRFQDWKRDVNGWTPGLKWLI